MNKNLLQNSTVGTSELPPTTNEASEVLDILPPRAAWRNDKRPHLHKRQHRN